MTNNSRPAAGRRDIERFLRVDHAGERAAQQIYRGQLAILRNHSSGPEIQHMMEQEIEHLQTFERLLNERRVRPSVLDPVWGAAGFALGAVTAAMGPKAAMACTIAVEEVIGEHCRGTSRARGNVLCRAEGGHPAGMPHGHPDCRTGLTTRQPRTVRSAAIRNPNTDSHARIHADSLAGNRVHSPAIARYWVRPALTKAACRIVQAACSPF